MVESTLFLLIANLATLAFALVLRWPMEVLLWPYWIQSAVIGYFARQRLVVLERTLAAESEPEQLDERGGVTSHKNPRQTMSIATFFTVFYGGWFLLFLGALVQSHTGKIGVWDVLGITVSGVIFAYNHWFSYRKNAAADIAGKPSLLSAFVAPFVRAVPMFVGGFAAQELAGGKSVWAVVAFCLVKTAIDVVAHRGTHRLLR
jgi:Family of unknown function (DUF6498)